MLWYKIQKLRPLDLTLLLLDERLTKEEILHFVDSLLTRFRRNPESFAEGRAMYVAEALAVLVTDKRVDTYEWLKSVEKKRVFLLLFDILLDEENVRRRLTEEQVVELL